MMPLYFSYARVSDHKENLEDYRQLLFQLEQFMNAVNERDACNG